jgi:hypothetical protein
MCFKCKGYGHSAKNCITVKYVEVGNHEEKNCPAENEKKCINCSKYNTKSGGQNERQTRTAIITGKF